MNRFFTITVCVGLLALFGSPAVGLAALPIELEVAKEPGITLSAPQRWAQLLGRMNLATVRIRGIRAGERPLIEEKSRGTDTSYRVVAILSKRNELILPSRRFRMGERKALQKYFEQLPVQAAHNAEERGRFGLTEKQFRQVFGELSQPIDFSTVGKTPSDIFSRLEKTQDFNVTGAAKSALRQGKPLQSELQNLTMGTGLAIALRQVGLTLRPEQLPGHPLQLSITPYDAQQESWPVGWKPAASARKSAPKLFELRNIEINGFTLRQALTALQPALQIPVVMDDWILAQQQIDPSKIQVSLPKKRAFLKSAVSKLLSQARLAEEVRVDELDQPFLWVTRFGKGSRPATK